MTGDADKVIALLPWDITVRRATARKQAYALLDRTDADEAIRGLSEVETYYLVKELGIESSLPMLAVLEPRQICALVDLDVWHDDRPNLDDLLLWLEAFKEADVEQVRRAVRSIDPELFTLLLRRRLHIAIKPRSDEAEDVSQPAPAWLVDPPESILPLHETPDRRFILAARTVDEEHEDEHGKEIDEESRKLMFELIDALYADEDVTFVTTALKTAHDELSSSLEDQAQRFRAGRMEDLGFPELSRALELYAPLDADRTLEAAEARLPEPDLLLPALHASRFANGFLQEVLEAIESPETIRRVEGELLALANAAAVADRVEPGDLSRLREVLDRVRALLELALSHRSEPGQLIELARERLERHSLRTLFRVGFGITLELGWRAARLKTRGSFAAGGEPLGLLADEERAFIAALDGPRPRFAIGEVERPFAGAADVARARAMLDELTDLADELDRFGLAAANEALGGDLDPPIAAERTADMLLATCAANVILERGFRLVPLDRVDLGRVRDRLHGGRFDGAAIARAVESANGAAGDRIRRGLDALAEALSPLVGGGEIDPRFVGVVVRRLH